MPSFADSFISLADQGTVIGHVVSTPADNAAAVRVAGIVTTIRILSGVSVSLDDVVLIQRHGSSRFVIGVIEPTAASFASPDPSASSDTSFPAPTPKPTTTSGTLICAPTQTCTYRSSTWRSDLGDPVNSSDVLQGVWPGYGNNTGCAFYGTKPQSLSGATVTDVKLQARRLQAGDFSARTSTLRLVTQSTRPSGAPTLNESTSGPRLAVGKSTTTFDVPNSWGQALVDGTRGGIAVYTSSGSPYMKFAGRNTWSGAWILKISWTRG